MVLVIRGYLEESESHGAMGQRLRQNKHKTTKHCRGGCITHSLEVSVLKLSGCESVSIVINGQELLNSITLVLSFPVLLTSSQKFAHLCVGHIQVR